MIVVILLLILIIRDDYVKTTDFDNFILKSIFNHSCSIQIQFIFKLRLKHNFDFIYSFIFDSIILKFTVVILSSTLLEINSVIIL